MDQEKFKSCVHLNWITQLEGISIWWMDRGNMTFLCHETGAGIGLGGVRVGHFLLSCVGTDHDTMLGILVHWIVRSTHNIVHTDWVFALFSSRFGWHPVRRWHSIALSVLCLCLFTSLSNFSGTWAWHSEWLTSVSASRRCWRWRTWSRRPGLTSSPWWLTSPSSITPWPLSIQTTRPAPSQTPAYPQWGAPSHQAAGQFTLTDNENLHFLIFTHHLSIKTNVIVFSSVKSEKQKERLEWFDWFDWFYIITYRSLLEMISIGAALNFNVQSNK